MKPVIAMPRMENSLLRCYMIYKYRQSLRRAGATIEGEDAPASRQITKQDLMELGLSGGADASAKRLALLKKLDLPEHMSSNAMLQALNLLYTKEELSQLVDAL